MDQPSRFGWATRERERVNLKRRHWVSLFLLQYLHRQSSGPVTFHLLSYNTSEMCHQRCGRGPGSEEAESVTGLLPPGPAGGNAANLMGNEQRRRAHFSWTIDLLMSSGSRRATLEVNWCRGSICLLQEALQPLIKPPPPHHLTAG